MEGGTGAGLGDGERLAKGRRLEESSVMEYGDGGSDGGGG